MSEHESNIKHYLDAIRSICAVKLAEVGGSSSALTERLIGAIDWATQVHIHALMEFSDSIAESAFDSSVLDAGKYTSVDFELHKYKGSQTEKLDAMMEAAEFDAVTCHMLAQWSRCSVPYCVVTRACDQGALSP